MAIRNVIKVSVTPAAKNVIADTAGRLGMKEIAVASRVYEWFSKQDDVVRKGVLGLLPEGYESELIKMVLADLAAGGSGKAKAERGSR